MLLPTAHGSTLHWRANLCDNGSRCTIWYSVPLGYVRGQSGAWGIHQIDNNWRCKCGHTDYLACAVGKSMCPQIQVVLHGVSRRALQEVFITACSWGTNVDIAHAIHRLSPNAPQRLSRHNTVAAHIGVQICVVMDVDARSSIVFR